MGNPWLDTFGLCLRPFLKSEKQHHGGQSVPEEKQSGGLVSPFRINRLERSQTEASQPERVFPFRQYLYFQQLDFFPFNGNCEYSLQKRRQFCADCQLR